jgi:phosphatidate cytidylyltransferase
MFKQRFLTAMILIPLVLLAITKASAWVLAILMGGFLMLAGWEWLALIPLVKRMHQVVFLGLLLVGLGFSTQGLCCGLWVGFITWGLVVLAILTYPRSQVIWGKSWIVGGVGLLLLPLVAGSMGALYQHPQGPALIIYLFCLVWATDSGGYLVGKQWGRHRLIPQVSPGKTIEGVLGGIGLALMVACMGLLWFHQASAWLPWFTLAAGTVLISIVGDLFISMLKRRCQLKDTGSLFPGHGGVLDRLDSFIAAAPFFYAGLQVWFNELT